MAEVHEGEEPIDEDFEDIPAGPACPHDLENPPDPVVNELSREEHVIEEDTAHFNYMLKRIQPFWKMTLDVEDYCKLSNTTMKLLEMRRKMMLFRTERPKDDRGNKGGGFFGAFND